MNNEWARVCVLARKRSLGSGMSLYSSKISRFDYVPNVAMGCTGGYFKNLFILGLLDKKEEDNYLWIMYCRALWTPERYL